MIRLLPLIPDPEHAWIAFAPREWPAAPREAPWIDLARGRLGEPGRGESVSALHGEPFADVVYLPPVESEFSAERNQLAAHLAAPGTPVLVQLRPGETPPTADVTLLWDPTAALLEGDFSRLSLFPPSSSLLFPLLPGVTDTPDFLAGACRHLAQAGAAVVHPVIPSLTPAERRHLADTRDEATFDRLFHGPPPDLRAFARIAHSHGLSPFLPRPLPRPPLVGAGNREVAGLVAWAAELGDRLGRPAMAVQSLMRAARFLDRTHLDVRALAREGHLGLLDALDVASREIVTEWAASGRSRWVEAAMAEYLSLP
ncbi:MAG: hypothetical protein SF066_19610 [Thermoanaerobaculia bacterium]|nr:hypothetical protein [Thermoanaerobaculia bacterium]